MPRVGRRAFRVGGRRFWFLFLVVSLAGLFGVIPLWLINIVINRCKTGLQDSSFFTLKGNHRILNHYGPFVVSL